MMTETSRPITKEIAGEASESWWSVWTLVELFAVFCIGFSIISFFYTHPDIPVGGNVGVPGHDSGYHIKMAQLMPEIGLVDDFPWLQTTIFHKDRFISHHWGFQAMMIPFIKIAEWRGFDAMTGGRWAISTFFGLVMVAFFLLLQSERVRFRWLWLGLFLAIPHQFFGRMVFIRAIDLSLFCMLLLIFFMFRKRYVLAGLTIAIYIQMYLGGLIYAPILVVIVFVCHWLIPRSTIDPWKLVIWTLLGWCVGLRLHPYFDGAIEFLRVQVLGSGLTPDISVGREWASFNEVWWFAQMTSMAWAVLGIALFVRLLNGRKIRLQDASLLLIQTVFLVLMCKSRRFVEYWPAFALLASAFLMAPILRRSIPDPFEAAERKVNPTLRPLLLTALLLTTGILFVLFTGFGLSAPGLLAKLPITTFFAEWQVWVWLALIYFLAPCGMAAVRARRNASSDWIPVLLVPLLGAGFAGIMLLVGRLEMRWGTTPESRIPFSFWFWYVPMILYVLIPLYAVTRSARKPGSDHIAGGLLNGLIVLLTGVSFMLLLCVTVSVQMVNLQKSVKCGFDLESIESAMNWLKENTPQNSIVFTDDWDIFPIYFYYNHHNRYIVGLDPKFTHEISPVLWKRYEKLSRGQFPERVSATWVDPLEGDQQSESIQVVVDDIVNYFNCDYVIVDRDHGKLAGKLMREKDKAERVYPQEDENDNPAYQIFRMKRENIETPHAADLAKRRKGR